MYLSLHTADPQNHGLEATEASYVGYKRVCIDGLIVSFKEDVLVNLESVRFVECKEMHRTLTHFALVMGDVLIVSVPMHCPVEFSHKQKITPDFGIGSIQLHFGPFVYRPA